MSLQLIEQSPLVLGAGELWRKGTSAEFLSAISDGNLPSEAFHRWLVQDHAYFHREMLNRRWNWCKITDAD